MNNNENEVLASRLRKQVSFKALLKADGHKFQGRGRESKCFCPFHHDEVATFALNRVDTDGYCQSCLWIGGVVEYIMQSRKTDLVGAQDFLQRFFCLHPEAGQISITIPKIGHRSEEDETKLKIFLEGN